MALLMRQIYALRTRRFNLLRYGDLRGLCDAPNLILLVFQNCAIAVPIAIEDGLSCHPAVVCFAVLESAQPNLSA
jgi:hypothetical protein